MPFSIAPDPSYFYLSNQHRDALTLLRNAVAGQGGVALLTGEVGTGKTTVCRRLLGELSTNVDVLFIHNPCLTQQEFLATICNKLAVAGADEDAPAQELARLFEARVVAAGQSGRITLLIIDEAQNLDGSVLEQLRQLCLAVQDAQGQLRLVLIGQPELNQLLAQPENARFDAIVSVRHHLGPLDRADVVGYVMHRICTAGGQSQIFPRRLMRRLYAMSEGIPRVINLICDRALLGAYVLGKNAVNARILDEARAEALGRTGLFAPWRRFVPVAIGSAFTLAAGACLAVVLGSASAPGPVTAAMPDAHADAAVADLDPMDASDWPVGMTGKSSEALAHAALLKRWGAAPDGQPPCSPAERSGLRCIRGFDDFDDLRRLNIPAVLELMDKRGRKMSVALVRMHRDQAVLQLGDTVRRVPVHVLQSQWTRRYTVLWRPPPALAGEVVAGSAGPAVDWIRARIARLEGTEAETLPPRLEGALRARLQSFQMLEGLRPTGTGDLRTLVHLSLRTEAQAPALEADGCKR